MHVKSDFSLRHGLQSPGTTNDIRRPTQIGKTAKKNELGSVLRPTTTTTLVYGQSKQKKSACHTTDVYKTRISTQVFLQIHEQCVLQTNLTLQIFPHLY